MRALTVLPGKADTVRVAEVPDPAPGPGELLVRGVAVGVCGTDREIAAAEYGQAPPGRDRLVLGHESLGRVVTAPASAPFAPGDLVVGIVRRPDPVPCGACERGEFDMCRNGQYTERGIKQLDGFASQYWTIEADYAVRLEPRLVADLGAQYHTGDVEHVAAVAMPDVVIEATGVPKVVFDAMRFNAACGIVCLTGVSPAGRALTVDAGSINRDIVLENDVVFGSVNAAHRHYLDAARALQRADPAWLERLITRRVPLRRALEAFDAGGGDEVKTVIDL